VSGAPQILPGTEEGIACDAGRSPALANPLHHRASAVVPLPASGEDLRGSLVSNGSLADFIWFRTGGPAEWLYRPADVAELSALLRELPDYTPVLPIGVGSNLIVRDGGVQGVVVRLPKSMARVAVQNGLVRAGGAAMGITVASAARDAGIAGLEFLRGIPGTVGGAVKMNAGAYGRDTADILVEVTVVLRDGTVETWPAERLGYTYRHSALPDGAVVVEALFRGEPGDPATIGAEMDRIAAEREASQPLRSRTGGSTFKNPPGHKAWALIDAAGCRGLRRGDAQVSEKHCNFLLNLGTASSAEIEALGEEVRARVKAHAGLELEWEIQRVGVAA
jgi:UDP-N-acetylmuramate dehydrogenase